MDMSAFVVPKSDQLNADDLIGGPRTITIAKVSGTGNGDQPVAVYFEGDGGKPFKPCKSMRRVMIAAWGPNAAEYAGRSMTIYCDPEVAFGGMKVGGIRISHMSHIERALNLALTVTKAKRAPYIVKPLEAPKPQTDAAAEWTAKRIAEIEAAASVAALETITGHAKVVENRAKMRTSRPDLADKIDAAVTRALSRLADDDIFPGDKPSAQPEPEGAE
jgi:hypothetical protein